MLTKDKFWGSKLASKCDLLHGGTRSSLSIAHHHDYLPLKMMSCFQPRFFFILQLLLFGT